MCWVVTDASNLECGSVALQGRSFGRLVHGSTVLDTDSCSVILMQVEGV